MKSPVYIENAPVLTKYRIQSFSINRSTLPAIYAARKLVPTGVKPSHPVYCYIILSHNCR